MPALTQTLSRKRERAFAAPWAAITATLLRLRVETMAVFASQAARLAYGLIVHTFCDNMQHEI
jgi:hypothetical protein